MTRSLRIATALCAALCSVSYSGNGALAATVSSNLTIAAAVDVRCSIATFPFDFGTYSLFAGNMVAPLDYDGGISIVCGPGRVVRVRLDQGLNPAAGSTDADPQRQMAFGTDVLSYNLYVDAARTQVWSNISPGERPAGNTFPVVMPIYGRVPQGQPVQAGTYVDTVVATVTF